MAEQDYMTQLNEKLQAARKRVRQGNEVKALKDSAPTLFEIMDTEISLIVNSMTQEKPLSYDEYLSAHGKVRGVISIRNLLDSKEVEAPQAQAEVKGIQENMKQIKDDQKQQS